jgi:hypothetical protein
MHDPFLNYYVDSSFLSMVHYSREEITL